MSFGKGKKSNDITAPDPLALARQQADLNRGNQYTPFGNLLFEGPNRENSRIQLTPQQQLLVDRAIGNAGMLEAPQDPQAAQNAAFQSMYSRIQPDFDMRQRRLQSELDASGNPAVGADLAPGAVSELDVLNRARNDALNQASALAYQAGPQYQLANQQVQGNYQNMLNSVAQTFGGGLFGAGGASPIDLMGGYQLMQNAQSTNAQIAAQGRSDKNATIGRLGSAAIMGAMLG